MRANNASDLAPLAKEIDEHFKNSDYETRSMTESDALADGLSSLGNIRGIVFALCVVVVLTVLLIAANSTVMLVREQIERRGGDARARLRPRHRRRFVVRRMRR